MKKPISNTYKVSLQLWRKLSPQAKVIFNSTMMQSVRNQSVVKHPKMVPIDRKYWNTICFNISLMAAWAHDGVPLVKGDEMVTGKSVEIVK